MRRANVVLGERQKVWRKRAYRAVVQEARERPPERGVDRQCADICSEQGARDVHRVLRQRMPTRHAVIAEPALAMADDFEYSIHEVPSVYNFEFQQIFPNVPLEKLLIVPTCQKSTVDLVNVGKEVEEEKDRLLLRFMSWAKAVCDKLTDAGYWADYCDPCSGLLMIHTGTNAVYNEVDALHTLLGYSVVNAGCCKVVSHPKWGTSIYPSTLFTTANPEALQSAIQAVRD